MLQPGASGKGAYATEINIHNFHQPGGPAAHIQKRILLLVNNNQTVGLEPRIATAQPFANITLPPEGLGNKLPTSLNGVSVTVNSLPAAVYFVDPGQISFQVLSGVGKPAEWHLDSPGADRPEPIGSVTTAWQALRSNLPICKMQS